MAIACSSSLSLMWALLNMLQLINLIPLLNVPLPENLRIFIGEYLKFSHFRFDFLDNVFHKWNIINLSEVNDTPFNSRFADNDCRSQAFLVNYGGTLMFWAFILALYPIAWAFAKCTKLNFFIKIKKSYEFTILFTAFNEAYLEFTLFSFINLYMVIDKYIYIYI